MKVLDHSTPETREKQLTLLQLQKIKIYSRGMTDSRKPNNLWLDKIKRRVQKKKFKNWEKVAAATWCFNFSVIFI